jgi:hypothetical protein
MQEDNVGFGKLFPCLFGDSNVQILMEGGIH